jgi:hypothetical protein
VELSGDEVGYGFELGDDGVWVVSCGARAQGFDGRRSACATVHFADPGMQDGRLAIRGVCAPRR